MTKVVARMYHKRQLYHQKLFVQYYKTLSKIKILLITLLMKIYKDS
jgi:hypothetical protein